MKNIDITKAQAQIDELVNILKSDRYNILDLKLHYASYYSYTDMEKDFPLCFEESDTVFNNFCLLEYEDMLEYFRGFGIDFNKIAHYIRRTNKFYLHNYGEDIYDITLYTIIEDAGYSDNNIGFLQGKLSILSDDDETMETLEYIENHLVRDFIDGVDADIKIVYDYIHDFKHAQVEIFKDFCRCEEERLNKMMFDRLLIESPTIIEKTKNAELIQHKDYYEIVSYNRPVAFVRKGRLYTSNQLTETNKEHIEFFMDIINRLK